MIKNYLFFLIVLFLYNCSDSKHQDKAVNKKENFVYLEKNQFKINGNDFFPIMLNYCICIRNVDSQYVASPLKGFGLPFRYDSFSKDSIHKTIETHFKIIKNMGFNSIRLVGPGRFKQQNNKLYLQVFTPKTTKLVPLDEHYDSYLNSIKSVVEMAKQQNLKILFLVGDEYWDFIGGKGTFPELLKTFDEVGKQFKEQLNQKFKDIAKEKLDSY